MVGCGEGHRDERSVSEVMALPPDHENRYTASTVQVISFHSC